MKRLTVLLLAMALCLGSVGAAQADGIDIKVKGQWDFSFGWVVNNSFKDAANRSQPGGGRNALTNNVGRGDNNDSFMARHRVRTQINFITSEYLQGVLMFEIGDLDWGRGTTTGRGAGGRLDTDGVNIETKLAYLDWIIPYTEVSVRMGLQTLTLPSTPMGSPLFDADVAGVVVSSPITDWLAVTAFWIRPFDAYRNDTADSGFVGIGNNMDDETDAFGILLPMSFTDWGVNFTPWFIYGFVGANSGIYDYLFVDDSANTRNSVQARGGRSNVYWIGGHLEFTLFDPLVFNLEAIYGHLRPTALDGIGGNGAFGNSLIPSANARGWSQMTGFANEIGTSGWFLAATLDYKLDFMTPGIFGWWASGDKADSAHTGKLGRMPVLGNDSGSFGPTSFGSAGYYGIGQYSNSGTIIGTGTGTWGVGIQLADISFIEDLKHTLRFAYYRGTNDADLVKGNGNDLGIPGLTSANPFFQYTADRLYLTTEDSVFEINFDHQYKIYENLTAVLELGWLHLSTDEATWRRYRQANGGTHSGKYEDSDNAWKAQLSFRYSF